MIQNFARILFTARSAIQLLTLTATVVAVSAGSAESDLIRQLLQDYNSAVRPVLNPGDAINVTVSLGLKTFIELDMRSQTAVSFGWLKIVWKDEFLKWDPSDHANVTALHVPAQKVWCPHLVIFNTLSDIKALNDQQTEVAIQKDGKMLWYPGGIFHTYCTVDITYYPFDTQLCSIDVITWSLPVQFLNGTFDDPMFDYLDFLENHPTWELIHTDSEYEPRSSGYWVLKFKLRIKRKTLFYVINIILPMTLLSSLSSLVFVLPAQSGEKMTVCVTSFLSLAVFVSFINEVLPQNSDSLCFFSVYVMVQMLLSLCATAACAFTVSLVHKQQDRKVSNPKRNHTGKSVGLQPSQETSYFAPTVNAMSLSSFSEYPSSSLTSRSVHTHVHSTVDAYESSLHSSFQNIRDPLNGLFPSVPDREIFPDTSSRSQRNDATPSSFGSVIFPMAPSPKNVKSSMTGPALSGDGGRQKGKWLKMGERQVGFIGSNSSHTSFLDLLALRVDKVFLVIMLSANLISCLAYTLSMTWAT